MHAWKQARFACETLLARAGLRLIPGWPRPVVLRVARVAGTVAWLAARGQRRVAQANLALAFGDRLSRGERRRLARRAFQTMALVFLDLLWFSRRTEDRVRRLVAVEPGLAERLAVRPVIGVTAHFGNWELLSAALGIHGLAHVAVAAPLQNPGVDALMGASRARPGVSIVPRQGAIRGLLRALRQGRHVALLLDQNTKPGEGGLFVEFFGQPIAMSSAAAVLAARTSAPVVPLFCRACPDGTYRISARPDLPCDPSAGPEPVQAATQQVASVFEQEIRAWPDQWLWMYKRWKYIDPARPSATYPFYAKRARSAGPAAEPAVRRPGGPFANHPR